MAAIKYNLPPSLELKGNVAENFRRWKLLFNNYMLASKQNKLKDEEKLPLLFNMAGHEVILKQERILQGLTEEEKKDYGLVMKALQKYCTSQGATNEVFERFVFHQRNQEPGEPFDHFYDEIQDLVKTCNYKEPSKELRDRIVQGILDKTLQETFLKTRDLTEELVVQACRAAESARLQVQKMNAPEVHHLSPEKSKKNGGNGGKGGKKNNNEPPSKVKDEEKKADDDQKPKYKFKCWACDTIHPKFKCPAWGQTCDNCKKKNHLTKQCRYEISVDEIRVQVDKEKQEIEEMFVLEELEVQETYRTKFLPGQKKEWREMVIIEGQPVYAKLDPGSEVNVLPVQVFEKMNKPLRPGPRLSLYGGKHVIATLGSAVLEVESRDQTFYLEFLVVQNGTPLLGIEDSERLNLVRRVHHVEVCKEEQENFLEANKDIFTGTGKFPGELTLCVEDGKIKQSVPHRLPNSINKKLKPQLDLMEKNGIITKVKEIKPTMVINNLVVFEKSDGSLRVCLDPGELNKVIRRRPCFIPTMAEIKEKMANKRYYSVFDLKEGFYHCALDKKSSELCCFATQHGVYRFLRLPFGVASAPEDFQAINMQNFGDIEGVLVYIDDLACVGETKEEHDRVVEKVLQRARERNVKFNPKKLQYAQESINYVGHVFTAGGHKPDPDRVKALIKMPSPRNKAELDRAMGMFNYVRDYIPHMSTIVAPLRRLMKKNSLWVWCPDQEKAFTELKIALARVTLLTCPDVNQPFELQCDASKDGLGACLLQQVPAAFASRAMNSAECNYSQTEKELLAIVFGFKKFHQLLYGATVEVVTDHKPLVAVMNKKIDDIGSNRLKLLRLKILKYSFKITYRPGKQMYLADHFSRTYLEETEAEDPEMGACVHSLSLLPVTDQKLQDIKNATKEDGTLRLIMQYVMNGWPKHYSELPADCKPYWQHRPDLHVQDGLLLKEKKIVLPSSLRREIMAKLHAGHAGRDKTIARARLSLYWPNYTEDIEAFVAECHTCAKFRPRLSKPEMMPHEIPLLVWNKLGMDLMKYGGQEYLVLMDYFSKWLEIVPVTDKRAVTIVSVLSQIFATHGYPATIICDNVPFNAYELQKYAAGKFDIITTSPTYASSNGLAESAVNIAKQIMKKADEDKKPYGELLREYRATPISGYEFSPAQILFSRQIKTEVPCMEELLQPKLVQEDLHKLMSAKKKLIKEKHDAKVKRSEIQYVPGESVLIRNRHEKVWTPGEVVSAHTTPRSYWVKKPNGVLVRRNEAHIQRKPVGRPAVIPHPLQTPDPAAADFKTSSMPELIPIDEIPEEEQDTSGQEENLSEFVLVLPDHYFDL